MKFRFASLIVPLCVLAAGCASTPLKNDSALEQEVQELKTRITELQRRAAVSDVELARLRQQVTELEGQRGGGTAPRPAPTGAGIQGSTAPTTPTTTAPRTTTTATPAPRTPAPRPATSVEHGVAAGTDRIEEADIDLPEPAVRKPATPAPAPVRTEPAPAPRSSTGGSTTGTPSSPPASNPRAGIYTPPSSTRPTPPAATTSKPTPTPPVTAAPAPETPAAPAPAPATSPATGGSADTSSSSPAAQALYDRGYTLYHQGHFVDAEASFQRFLQATPPADLADNAQYWIGECRYARGDMRGALDAFRETVQRYPTGNKVPDALLKAGQSLEALGNPEGARESYGEVIRRFAGTAAAAVAEERRGKLP